MEIMIKRPGILRVYASENERFPNSDSHDYVFNCDKRACHSLVMRRKNALMTTEGQMRLAFFSGQDTSLLYAYTLDPEASSLPVPNPKQLRYRLTKDLTTDDNTMFRPVDGPGAISSTDKKGEKTDAARHVKKIMAGSVDRHNKKNLNMKVLVNNCKLESSRLINFVPEEQQDYFEHFKKKKTQIRSTADSPRMHLLTIDERLQVTMDKREKLNISE